MPDEIKWIKITTGMFDDEKIRVIESLPDRDAILIIWIKLLTLAGKCNKGGLICLDETIPYTEEMLATLFGRPVNTVRLALDTFIRFRMVERYEQGLFITNWAKHQNIETMDRVREHWRLASARYREKKDQLLLEEAHHMTSSDRHNPLSPPLTTPPNPQEKDKDKDREKDKDKDRGVPPDTLLRGNEKGNEETGETENPAGAGPGAAETWEKVKSELKRTMAAPNYRTWIDKTVGLDQRDGQFIIGVPNSFVANYLAKHQISIITKVIMDTLGADVSPVFEVRNHEEGSG